MTTVQERRKKAKSQALIFGSMSVALYAATYAFADSMVTMFAKGGFYSLLPVMTVFLFSYVHGNFASSVWTALGIEASSKAGKAKTTTVKQSVNRSESRNRAATYSV